MAMGVIIAGDAKELTVTIKFNQWEWDEIPITMSELCYVYREPYGPDLVGIEEVSNAAYPG